MPIAAPPSNEPYCSNCGYVLTNLTQSSKCPECGRPLVEILTRRNAFGEAGKRYRSKATIFGLPLLDIAIGPKNGEMRGKARGFIAIGDIATGWVAVGGIARGGVAIGGVAAGVFAIGGLSLGLVTALGGLAVGGLAAGGMALGGLVAGGGAAGFIAQGGGAIGYYARGGSAWGMHTMPITPQTAGSSSPAADVFNALSWYFGGWPPTSGAGMQPLAIIAGVTVAVAALLGLIALLAWRSQRQSPAGLPPP
jgi:predicted RNA-binding Zn-ribbon protein involved in translation (DUF1610 family)